MRSRLALVLPCLLTLIGSGACDRDAPEAASAPSASASAEPPAVKRVRFVHAPVQVGQRWRRKRTSRMKVSVEFWTEAKRWAAVDSLREETMDVTDEVVKRVGGWPGKVKATYNGHHLVEDHPDNGKRDEHPLEGRSFILDHMNKEPVATDLEGKAVSEDEFQFLWAHHTQLGKADALLNILMQRPIPVGKTYPLKGFMFTALLGAEMGEYESGHFAIERVEKRGGERIALFKWTARMQSKEDNGMVMDWELTGKTEIAVEPARLVSQDIKANIAISGRTRKDNTWLRIEGAGTMTDHREQAIEK